MISSPCCRSGNGIYDAGGSKLAWALANAAVAPRLSIVKLHDATLGPVGRAALVLAAQGRPELALSL